MEEVMAEKKRSKAGGILLTVGIVIVIVAAVAVSFGVSFWNQGYHGLPIASTAEEFDKYLQKSKLEMLEKVSEKSGTVCYELSPSKEDLEAYYYLVMNRVSTDLFLETDDWEIEEDMSQDLGFLGISDLYYVNGKDQVFRVETYGGTRTTTIYPQRTRYWVQWEWRELLAPDFLACGLIEKNDNFESTMEKLGYWPAEVYFYEDGYKDGDEQLSAGPGVELVYYVINGNSVTGRASFAFDAEKNALVAVTITEYN